MDRPGGLADCCSLPWRSLPSLACMCGLSRLPGLFAPPASFVAGKDAQATDRAAATALAVLTGAEARPDSEAITAAALDVAGDVGDKTESSLAGDVGDIHCGDVGTDAGEAASPTAQVSTLGAGATAVVAAAGKPSSLYDDDDVSDVGDAEAAEAVVAAMKAATSAPIMTSS